MNITINVPDKLGAEVISQLPNRDEIATQAFKKALESHKKTLLKTSSPTKEKGRWAKFAEEIKKEKLLYGLSEEVNKYSQEFRDNFAFKHDDMGQDVLPFG